MLDCTRRHTSHRAPLPPSRLFPKGHRRPSAAGFQAGGPSRRCYCYQLPVVVLYSVAAAACTRASLPLVLHCSLKEDARCALLNTVQIAGMSAPTQKLLIIGLCGDCIHVDWRQLDTVKHIKEQAFAAASANIAGVTSDQLSLVFGQGNDAVKLEDESVIQDCLSAHWRCECGTVHSPKLKLTCSQ